MVGCWLGVVLKVDVGDSEVSIVPGIVHLNKVLYARI